MLINHSVFFVEKHLEIMCDLLGKIYFIFEIIIIFEMVIIIIIIIAVWASRTTSIFYAWARDFL